MKEQSSTKQGRLSLQRRSPYTLFTACQCPPAHKRKWPSSSLSAGRGAKVNIRSERVRPDSRSACRDRIKQVPSNLVAAVLWPECLGGEHVQPQQEPRTLTRSLARLNTACLPVDRSPNFREPPRARFFRTTKRQRAHDDADEETSRPIPATQDYQADQARPSSAQAPAPAPHAQAGRRKRAGAG